MELEFVKSQKGKDMLVVEGCTFIKEKDILDKIIWKCTEYRKGKRILAIVRDYANRPLLDYLRGLSHNLNLQL